jgi:hypothetical protein
MTGRAQWYPTSDQKRVRYPDFLYAAPPIVACAAFFEESRMKFGRFLQAPQEIRGYGAPRVHLQRENSKEGFFTPSPGST